MLAASSGSTRLAAASPLRCEDEGRRWVAVRFQGQHWSPRLRQLVLQQLAASFDDLKLAACGPGPHTIPPAATIALRRAVPFRVHVSVTVRSGNTNAQVERDAGVARLNDQGLALAVAVHADELLRASRAALVAQRQRGTRGNRHEDGSRSGDGAPGRRGGSPQASGPAAAVASDGPPRGQPAAPDKRSQRPAYLGVEGVVEGFSSGEVLLGADAVLRHTIVRPVGIELVVGGRGGPGANTAVGTVHTAALSLRAGATLRLLSTRRWALDLVPAARFLYLHVEGRATDPGLRGRQARGTAVYGQADLVLWVRLSSWLAAALRVGGGVPLRGAAVVASGQDDVVAGASGVLVTGALGLGVSF